MKTTFSFLTLLVAFPGLSPAQNCVQWIKRTDVGSYGQRYQHAMAYDSDRGVTVFFGGQIGPLSDVTYFNDTQEYDGKQWKQISTAVRPPARSDAAMAYDPIRKKIVMFGGCSHIPQGPTTCYGETWVYTGDGVNGFWEMQQPATTPGNPGSTSTRMVWDAAEGVVLLHMGGGSGSTWAWNGTNWLNTHGSGPQIARFGMAFDTERATTMIYGGYFAPENTDRVWEKGPGTGWQDRGPGPPRRWELAMAYHERRKRIMVVGGGGDSIETGETAYEYIPGTGWITLPSLPSGQGRAGANMVYDSKRGVMVLTGGAGGGAPNAGSGGRYSDTWELWPSLFISGQPSSATNLACSTAAFSVFVQGAGPFQYQWRLDGAALSDNTHFSGSQTADLQINGVRQTHAGKYDVVVRDSCVPRNVVTSSVATLTITPESEWVFRTTNGPPARFAHGMVYDRARHVTVLFGGQTNRSYVIPFNDLWEWDGARWMQRMENSISNGWKYVPALGWRVAYTNVPVRRTQFAMAYDSRRGVTLIFGGYGVAPDNGSSVSLRDLWEWDGERWHFRGTNGPAGRLNGSMAYDEQRGRTVLFGGRSFPTPGQSTDTDLVWEWDGARWHTNRPPLNPHYYDAIQARMIYDSFRHVITFGPSYESYSSFSFWDWDGVKWVDPAPVVYHTDPVLSVLNGTVMGGFAFDENRRRSIWFGGVFSTTQNKTALFDGKKWTLLTNGILPSPRTETAMAYDSDRHVMVMFGGNRDNSDRGATNDTWELIALDLPLINEHPASQYRLAGETATFSVSAVAPTFLSYQWYRGSTPIPGATGSTFVIANVQPADADEYSVRVSNACGEKRSRSAILTLDPKLHIFTAENTTTLIWPAAANVVLESAEIVIGPWSVVPNASSPFAISTFGPAKFFRLREVE